MEGFSANALLCGIDRPEPESAGGTGRTSDKGEHCVRLLRSTAYLYRSDHHVRGRSRAFWCVCHCA